MLAMKSVLALFHYGEAWLIAFLMTLPRIYAYLLSSTMLARSSVPRLARQAIILTVAMPITPIAMEHRVNFDGDMIYYGLYFCKEFAIGFIMGFCISWMFWSVQAAGAFIDNQRGAAIASSIDPLQGHETSPLGILFGQAFITYFFSIGGFLLALGLLYESYATWPIDRALPAISFDFPTLILELLDLGMRLAVVLAAPVIIVMFLAEFSLAMISRFAPQVQVFILAMPIKSAIAIGILIIYLPILMRYAVGYDDLFAQALDRFYSILEKGAVILRLER